MTDTTYHPVELHPDDVRKDPLEPFINDDGKAFNGNYRVLFVAVVFAIVAVAIVVGHII